MTYVPRLQRSGLLVSNSWGFPTQPAKLARLESPEAGMKRAFGPKGGRHMLAEMFESDEQRRQHQGDGGQQLDQNVKAGAGGVFERIADGVADNGSLVSV